MTNSVLFGTTPESLAREGLTETVSLWEDGLRADTGPGSFEWWYFDAHFDDGSTAVIVFSTKPRLGRDGPLRPGVAFTITRPDGTKLTSSPIFPAEQFSASATNCNVQIGPNWVKGDLTTYLLHVETPTTCANLTFTSLVPPWRPGAGKLYFGDPERYFAWLPALPHGLVTGNLYYDRRNHHVTGTGYHDHNWGNVSLGRVMDHWYWGRAHLGDYTLIYVEQIASQQYQHARMPIFMLAKGDQIVTGDSSKLVMQAANFIPHPSGRAWPCEVDFYWQDGGDTVHISLRQPELIEALSLLTHFPPWKRVLTRLFANPYYFRFNAELVLTLHLGNLHVTERGTALFELMILQGKQHP